MMKIGDYAAANGFEFIAGEERTDGFTHIVPGSKFHTVSSPIADVDGMTEMDFQLDACIRYGAVIVSNNQLATRYHIGLAWNKFLLELAGNDSDVADSMVRIMDDRFEDGIVQGMGDIVSSLAISLLEAKGEEVDGL